MRPRTRSQWLAACLVTACALVPPVDADQVSPSRLELREVEPGTFDITFSLPVVEGRRLRAEPALPPICRDLTERQAILTGTGYTATWTARCEPASLAGRPILVGGLLGTQVDIMLQIDTADGRRYSAVLKPSRAAFVVPHPPALPELAARAGTSGMRRIVTRPELWVLLLVVVFLGSGRRALAAGLGSFALAHAGALWLASQGWLLMSPHLPVILAALTALVPALDLARKRTGPRGWARPFWLIALLLGLLYGGAHPETVAPGGLSGSEQNLAFVAFGVGSTLGLLLLMLVAVEVRRLLALAGGAGPSDRTTRLAGYAAGVTAWGLLLYRAAGVILEPPPLPSVALHMLLLAAVLGAWLASVTRPHRTRLFAVLAGLLAAGLAPGLFRLPIPAEGLVVTGPLFLFGATLALRRGLPLRWAGPLAGAAALGAGWVVSRSIAETMSQPRALAGGAALLAVCTLFIALRSCDGSADDRSPVRARLLGASAALLAVIWRLGDYELWLDQRLAVETALGLLRLPLLSLALVAAAGAMWPRRRTALRRLGVETSRSIAHWVLLATAFFVLPYGTLAVRNPFFEPHAPTGDEARLVLAQVLSNTYHAFNLEDEDELYDRLAESVSGELVADLYLDSRRRLTAGTREGAQVTVKDVSVLALGDAVEGVPGGQSFSYDCRWAVTARVQHLQHVHHRQNIYNGILTIRVDEDRWKIARVELTSEDRVVLPWQPT